MQVTGIIPKMIWKRTTCIQLGQVVTTFFFAALSIA